MPDAIQLPPISIPASTSGFGTGGFGARNPIDGFSLSNDPKHLVSAQVSLAGGYPEDATVKEVIIGESLLNPSAHAAVTIQSAIYTTPKNWDQYRCQPIDLYISDQLGDRTMRVSQQIYRCDNRRFANFNTGQIEELTLHSIDNSILKDAQTIWDKSWKCSTPSQIVREALQKIGASSTYVDDAGPARPYAAESIHPLQVIQQQSNVALFNGNDPSFLHYMTIDENSGQNRHHFTALTRLAGQSAPYEIYASDTAITGNRGFNEGPFDNYRVAVTFSFPCDYDVLTDIMNGISCDGVNLNSSFTFNYVNGVFDAVNKGMDIANKFIAMTNLGTSDQQGAGGSGCETAVEKYLHLRQARMALLDRDKIALRITVPWSPWLHVGNKIKFIWINRFDPAQSQILYGSREYIIAHLTHNIQFGGYAVTNLDCIANTFGQAGG